MTIPDGTDVVDEPPGAASSSGTEAAPRPSCSTACTANRLVLVHTGVPEEWGGHGIGGRLVRAALAHAPRPSI